jgi:quercetin dioxygenase-like cupin family protein
MPFVQSAEMPTAEPLPGWKGRFWRSKQMSFAHYTISGELEVTIEGETAIAGPGDVAVVPPDARHAVRALSDGTAVVANHPVREELR